MHLHQNLSEHLPTLGVSHDGGKDSRETSFGAFLNVQEDRNRLIAYLKSNNQQVKYLVLNQPFKMRPNVDDP